MPTGPAARTTDNVMHPLPPVLTIGPGSTNVIIGFLPAWRAVPTGAGAALMAMSQATQIAITAAETATKAAAGTPGAPAALAAEQTLKSTSLAANSSAITGAAAAGSDIHTCTTPSPVPPHGPGVVIDGSATVMTNFLPQSRMGDTIIEAIGPPNKIMKGESTVIVGG